jgi:hypothetical protein
MKTIKLGFLLAAFQMLPSSAFAMEEACSRLAATGNCICSEPMAADEGGAFINNGHDFSDSPDASECMGNRSGMQSFGTSGTNRHKMVPVTGWGSVQFALNQKNGNFIWLNGANVVSGPAAFTSADRVQCYRYYQQVDANYSNAGSGPACENGGNQRNKLMQTNWSSAPNTLVQLQEAADSTCPAVGSHGAITLTVEVFGQVRLSPTITLGDCDTKPCRIELCIDGNLKTGSNIVHRARVHSIKTGVTGSVSLGPAFHGAPTLADFWGGDLFHSGPTGDSRNGYFMEARWQTDNDQWIGPACEIEGGCGGPPAPTNLRVVQ